MEPLKRVEFLGDSLARLREFPESARKEAGFQLQRLQAGLDPNDWKPMSSIGSGVREIRVRDEAGAFRVIYIATKSDAIYVLHAFQKKSQKTAQRDIDLARLRMRQI
jgi:phage-related protein